MILNRRYRGKIEKIPLPAQTDTLTYNGQAQSPAWLNYDSNKMTMSGVASSTNAGTFTATFTPKRGYCWEDGSRKVRNVTWSIGKATPTLSLGKTEFHVDRSYPLTDSTAVSCISDGNAVFTFIKNVNGKIHSQTAGENTLEISFSDGLRNPMKLTVSLENGQLLIVSEGKTIPIQLHFELYFAGTQNCNQSNACAFVVNNHGVAVGAR